MKRNSACIFIFAFLYGVSCLAAPATERVIVRTPAGTFSSSPIGRHRLEVSTPEGLHRFVFTERSPMARCPQYSIDGQPVGPPAENPALFQGQWINRAPLSASATSRAAASVTGDTLSVIFYGKRRGRLYELSAPGFPSGKTRPRAPRLRHFPSNYLIGCGVAPASIDLRSMPPQVNIAAAYSPERYIEISTDADREMYQAKGTAINSFVQTVLNAAEAIYVSQLGLRFDLVSQNYFTSADSPYSGSSASTLLTQFREYTVRNRHLGTADIYHLYTGKDLTSNIIGLAYVGAACEDNDYSFGLTRHVSSAIQALVTAHEIGHNFSATHPEESIPAAVPSLMTGVVLPSHSSFSSFSLGQISGHIDDVDPANQCLATSLAPRVRLSDLRIRASRGGRRARFSADLTASGIEESCDFVLYGAMRTSTLSNLSVGSSHGKELYRAPISADSISLSARFRNGNQPRRQAVYFRAAAECSGDTVYPSTLSSAKAYRYACSRNASQALGRIKFRIEAQ